MIQPISVSNELDSLARKLKNVLIKFYNKYIKGNPNPFAIKNLYGNRIKIELRKVIEEAYLKGINNVGKEVKIKIPEFQMFITVQDIENIEQTTNKMYNDFWNTVMKINRREEEYRIDKEGEFERLEQFNTQAAFISNSAFLAYAAYSLGVTEKMTQIRNIPQSFGISMSIQNISYKVRYARRNPPNVDPIICEPFRNKVYDITDPNKPVIPQHRHCKCQYVPIVQLA